jgi:hypothetical protein
MGLVKGFSAPYSGRLQHSPIGDAGIADYNEQENSARDVIRAIEAG